MMCEILVTSNGKQVSAGKFILSKGLLAMQPAHGYKAMFQEMLKERHLVGGRSVTVKQDPTGWFKALPMTYSGSYLRAKIL